MTTPVQGTGTLGSPGNTKAVAAPKFGKGLRSARGAATRPLQQAGEMLELLIAVIKSAVTNPRGYWGDVREQMFEILKLVADDHLDNRVRVRGSGSAGWKHLPALWYPGTSRLVLPDGERS
jgi:hypothetical protein